MKKFLSVMYHASDEELEAIRCHLEGGYRHKNKVYSGFKEVCRKDRRYDVCVDGELYNVKELRKALCAYGEDVKKAGLEELMLCAYCVWGHGCLLRFNGAFSLMIDDGNEIFVAKDPMGLKPIYYARRHHRGLSVANEMGLLWGCESGDGSHECTGDVCFRTEHIGKSDIVERHICIANGALHDH